MTPETKKECFEIAKNLRKGDILLYEDFNHCNGNISPRKFLIILSRKCVEGKFYYFVLTTSQKKFYYNPQNCIDVMWIKENEFDLLPKTTIIDLKRIATQRASIFGEKIYNGTISVHGRLTKKLLKRLNGKIFKAKTLNKEIKKHLI